MEFTEKGIPLSLKPAFQEYDIHQLDPERDAFTIIERTLARGKRDEVRWLFSRFGPARLVEWIQTYGWRTLPRRRLSFWANYFDLPSLPERENIFPTSLEVEPNGWQNRACLKGKFSKPFPQ